MLQRSATQFQALVGRSIAHPERLVRNLTRPRRTRRRRGSFGLVLGFAVLACLLALAVRFLPLSHPALPDPREGSVYNLG
jgi:ferric-dicitrate binding protein FerR (iron transport regulator)